MTAPVVCRLGLAKTLPDRSLERLPGTRREAFQAVPGQWLRAGRSCRARNAVLLQQRCAVRSACVGGGGRGEEEKEEGCGFQN